MISTVFSVMCGSLLLAPILIVIGIVFFMRRRFGAGVARLLLSAVTFVLALLPLGVYIVRVGPSSPGDANPVNIVEGFVLAQYGGVWTLESTVSQTSFETFDLMDINDEFILLVEGDETAPTSIRLVSRRSGVARPSSFDALPDPVDVDRWLAGMRRFQGALANGAPLPGDAMAPKL